MAKSSGQIPTKPKSSGDFRSARATVWRELGSIREAAKTGIITKVRDSYVRSDSTGKFLEKHKDKK